MRRPALFLLCALALACAGARAQGGGSGRQARAEREVLAVNRAWADAMVRNDRAALERIFADDLVVTSGSGAVRGKTEELRDAAPGPDLKTYFFNTEDLRVRVYGSAAVVTGHAKWRINFRGRDVDHERRYTSVFVRRRGRWQMVALQLTRIQPPPPAR